MSRTMWRYAAAMSLLIFSAACTEDCDDERVHPTIVTPSATIKGATIGGLPDSMEVGQVVSLYLNVEWTSGVFTTQVSQVTYASSAPAVAAFAESNRPDRLVALSSGQAVITATYKGFPASKAVQVKVSPPTPPAAAFSFMDAVSDVAYQCAGQNPLPADIRGEWAFSGFGEGDTEGDLRIRDTLGERRYSNFRLLPKSDGTFELYSPEILRDPFGPASPFGMSAVYGLYAPNGQSTIIEGLWERGGAGAACAEIRMKAFTRR